MNDSDILSDKAAIAASQVAVVEVARNALKQFQRSFAANPPDGAKGAILDGRDIGTIICPDADIKIFVTANLQTRARRRHKELLERGETSIYARVLRDMGERDVRDLTRTLAPLKPADDAFVLDCTALDADSAFAEVVTHIAKHLGPETSRRTTQRTQT